MTKPTIVTDAGKLDAWQANWPWADDFHQSFPRARWLLGRGQGCVVLVEHNDQLTLAALLEYGGSTWAMWKGPIGQRADENQRCALWQTLASLKPITLVLNPAWEFSSELNDCGFTLSGYYSTLLVPTSSDEAQVLRRMKESTRRQVRRALGSGLSLAENPAWLERYYPVYAANMQVAHSPDFATYDELQSLLQLTHAHLFIAVMDGQIAAGTVCLRHANALEARYVATAPEFRSLGALSFVHHQSLLWAARRGLAYFDLSGLATGAIDDKGYNINRFKLGFGGQPLNYPIYSHS